MPRSTKDFSAFVIYIHIKILVYMAGRILDYIESVNDMLNDLDRVYENPWEGWFELDIFEWKHFIDDRLFVEVKKGRSWKGTGYVVGYYEEQYYHWITRKIKVYDPIANEMHLVPAANVTLHPIYKEEFKAHMQMVIKEYFKASPEDMWRGFGMDHQNYFRDYLHLRRNFITIPNEIRCPEMEAKLAKRQAKQEEFKKEKMPELIKWAESKGKVGQEAIELAEKVWNKRYA